MLSALGTIVGHSLVSTFSLLNGVSFKFVMGAYGQEWMLEMKTMVV